MKNKYVSYAIWLLTLVAGVVWLPTAWYGAIDWRELELQYIPLCVAVLYYYSFIRLKAIYCKPLFESFLQKKPKKTFFSNPPRQFPLPGIFSALRRRYARARLPRFPSRRAIYATGWHRRGQWRGQCHGWRQ